MHAPPHVALLIETSNSYARDVLCGVRAYLREHQPWSLHLTEHGREDLLPQWLRQWKGDGIIARVHTQTIADALLDAGLPTVDVSHGLKHSPFPRIASNCHTVARLAAEHLLERGFKHFAYCGDLRFDWSETRRRLFAHYLRRAGFTCEVLDPVVAPNQHDTWEREIEALTEWIRGLPKPVGIMTCHDARGQQTLQACRRLGVAVPDSVAVIGVHNDDLLCDLCDPPLSSVIANPRRAGYEAAALLDRMMAGEKPEAQVILLEPLGVATRQSTDVIAVGDSRVAQAVRFIREHACEGISVNDVLRAVPMARSALERKFKKLLCRTPHEQILGVRITRVKDLLTSTELTLADIAERTGFETVGYLSVAFKRATGESPGRYRTKHRT